jgi:hypothetical protein
VNTPRFEYFWLLRLLEEPYPQAATALPGLLDQCLDLQRARVFLFRGRSVVAVD